MIYSFDLSAFEEGTLVATRFPASCGVSGDWVCCARSDKEVLRKVADAAYNEWAEPSTRAWNAYRVTFRDSNTLLAHRIRKEAAKRAPKLRGGR